MPCRTESRCCQALPLLCPMTPGTRRSRAGWSQGHCPLFLLDGIFISPAAWPWTWELNGKSMWLAAIPAQLPGLTWCISSQGRGDTREGAKVQPAIGVTWGQWGGDGRRSFQIVFPQIKSALCCSLLILSISKVKHFMNSAHLHPKTVRWPRCGMCSRGEHWVHGSIRQWPNQSEFSWNSSCEHTVWIKQEMKGCSACRMERRLQFWSLPGYNSPWNKGNAQKKFWTAFSTPQNSSAFPVVAGEQHWVSVVWLMCSLFLEPMFQ